MGLDHVLGGGFTPYRLYLIEGAPGAGKTTLALQFLLEGLRQGEQGLYITLSETAAELRANAATHGWSLLAGPEIFELPVADDLRSLDSQSLMFHASEVELGETMQTLFAAVERGNPARVVIGSLSELRLLAQSPLRYRRQILALKQFFAERQITVLLLDDLTAEVNDRQLESIAHGVVLLEHLSPEYGAERRRLRVTKFRGRAFRGGQLLGTLGLGMLATGRTFLADERLVVQEVAERLALALNQDRLYRAEQAARAEAEAAVQVQDQGIGIPAADLPHVFEHFRRASNVTAAIHGTGLGLASVRQIVEEHGGHVAASSTVNGGTLISVRLPLGIPGDTPFD